MQAAIKGTAPTAEDFPTDGSLELGMKAFEAFKLFRDALRVTWTDSELSLVSEQYQFGGTIDAVGVSEASNSTYEIGDWKTGRVYPDHQYQVAAYAYLFEECTGYHVARAHIVRFDKLSGDFVHRSIGEERLAQAWEVFLTKRRLYDQLKATNKDF